MNIIDLPLEVLDLIFKDLASQKEKLCLAQVHPVLGKAFSHHSRNKYHSIDPLHVPMNHWPVIVPLCGATVIEFKGHLNAWGCSGLKLIEQHCPNLETISLHVNNENCNGVKSLLSRMGSLRSVEVGLDCTVCLGHRELLQEFDRLKKLNLKGSSKDEINSIGRLVDLEELAVTALSDSEPIDILGVCSSLQSLRSLTVAKMDVVIPKEYSVSPCPTLETLLVIRCHIPTILPHFPQLKHLRIRHTRIPNIQWMLQHSATLERLELLYLEEPLQENVILEILQCCRKLQFLSIVLGDSKISQTFVNSILDIIKENGFQPKKPFELKVFKLNKFVEMRKLLAKCSNTELLKVTTDYPANPHDWNPRQSKV